ncbi:GNAT family N-acetyltransferase [Temperatibacter marinus]|uniref:GNAT family N-acetyltransferase n=1 Tax=Temperatibacter marinus TaxID=1456591 RepID=A0AA52ED37_9PROT|nr:GNAT family N-acetyltransferase [Temperatibacter marinus]WND02475.1 GNAT family N-acetyltransferase [Temperatibacter marinus]
MMEPHKLTIEVVDSISAINESDWQSCTDGYPFSNYHFLSALEESGSVGRADTGWIPQHFIVKDSNEAVLGFMPAYLKLHSQGEYVFDHGWAEAYERAGGRYYPKLQCSIPFTPATGPRLLARQSLSDTDTQLVKNALLEGARSYCLQQQLSSFHCTFMTDGESHIALKQGYLLRHDQQFHWYNDEYKDFTDFLLSLSSRKRKQIKKERRISQHKDLVIKQLTGHEMTEDYWDVFFQCYCDTGARKWGQPYLTRDFFELIGNKMPEKIMVVYVETTTGSPVASALNFIGKEAIYGRHWGELIHYDCLHFEACYYQAIDYAIKNKIGRVEAGAQGPHKVARGYRPTKTTSAHYLSDPGFHKAVHAFLESEHQHVDHEIEYLSDHLPFKKSE